MYFGSVKFFRHLILTVVFGWIGISTVLAVYFGIKCHSLSENQGAEDESQNSSMTHIEDYVADMKSKGISSEDILEYIRENDNEAFLGAVSDALSQPAMGTATETTAPVTEEDIAQTDDTAQTDVTDMFLEGIDDEQDVTDDSDVNIPDETTAVTTEQTTHAQTSEKPYEAPVTQAQPQGTSDGTDYKKLYSDMYAEGASVSHNSKSVYLTFSGCPSDNIYDLITILDRQDAVATFFISDADISGYEEQLEWICDTGSALGVLAGAGSSYNDAGAYLKDFYEIYDSIVDMTGSRPQVCRIPDSLNASGAVRSEIIAELERRGFVICTSNVSVYNSGAASTWQSIYDEVTGGVYRNSIAGTESVVGLECGDDDYITVLTVEDIIYDLIHEGYKFRAIG